MSQEDSCRLYIITPPVIDDLDGFAKLLDKTLAAGDVASLQLRLKDCEDGHVVEVGQRLMPICEKHEVALIVNDRPDLALEIDADGVHMGQDDGDIEEAREILGHDRVIGVTCHDSRHLAFIACEEGADYVAFGAFFPTTTKETKFKPEVEELTLWSKGTEIPCVAIGGVTPENCGELAKAGAHFVAACAAIWDHADGPAAAVKAFNKALAAV